MAVSASAGNGGKNVTPQPSAPPVKVVPAPPVEVPAVPSLEELIYLIRNVTIAVNQANLTNNYSVLSGLGTPTFQQQNPPEALAQRFAAIRQMNFDFGVVLAIAPQFSVTPTVSESGMLRLTGFYPTTPRVTFDFGFMQHQGQWRPVALGIGLIMPSPDTSQPPTLVKPSTTSPAAVEPSSNHGR